MFFSSQSLPQHPGARMAGLCAAVSSAIAYGRGMEDAQITVRQAAGLIWLEGTVPDGGMVDRAVEIAREVAGCVVHNRVQVA